MSSTPSSRLLRGGVGGVSPAAVTVLDPVGNPMHSAFPALLSLLLAGTLAACPGSVGPQEARCPPDSAGERVFGPTLADADSGRVYASVLSRDGQEFYFFKHVGPAHEDYRIYRALRRSAEWTPAQPVDLGGNYSDLYPAISPDGQRLVFASYRPIPGDSSAYHNAHIWMARRIGEAWSPPTFVAASRLGSYHSGLHHDSAGTLHLTVTSPDWRHTQTLQLRWTNTAFVTQLAPDPQPAASYWRGQLGDSVYVWGEVAGPGGLALIQISRVDATTQRRGPAHYFISHNRGQEWSPLIRAGGGLGSGAPNFAWFSADGCHIHFTRDYSEFVRIPLRLAKPPT